MSNFCRSNIQKARREIGCSECGGIIQTGCEYEYAVGRDDGSFWTARTCAACLAVREAIFVRYACILHFDEMPCFGRLIEWIQDSEILPESGVETRGMSALEIRVAAGNVLDADCPAVTQSGAP